VIKVKKLQGEKGWGRLQVDLRRYPKQAGIAVAFASYEAMQPVMEDAKNRAPKDTTAMAKSGYVAKPQMFSGGGTRVEGGFGGDSEQYVVRQHEDTALNHPNGGEAKFLQNALDAGEAGIRATIAKWLKVFLTTGKLLPFPQKRVPESPWEDRV
jgi:hypothetical protein